MVFSRKQVAVLGAEFLGTGVLALVMLSVQHSTIGLPYFVAAAAGLTLAMLTSVLSGNGAGHFNPAITIGMWTVRQMRSLRALAYLAAQGLGALAAYWLYVYFIKTDLQPIVTSNPDPRVMAAEAAGAFVLALAYAAAVFNGYLNAKRAATVGAAYALAIIVAASATIGIVNPAVAYAERAVSPSVAVWSTVGLGAYVLGPILGAVIGFNLYALLFAEESALLRVRSAVSQRLGRSRAASTTAAPAAEEKATPARRTTRSAGARRSTTRKTGTRRATSTRSTRSRRS